MANIKYSLPKSVLLANPVLNFIHAPAIFLKPIGYEQENGRRHGGYDKNIEKQKTRLFLSYADILHERAYEYNDYSERGYEAYYCRAHK
jgi:hypothetical protein